MNIKAIFQNPYSTSALSCLAGACVTLASAPFYYYPLSFIGLLIMIQLCQNCTAKAAAWCGWLFGVGLFATGVSWIYNSIHSFGNTSILLAGLITAVFVALLALYYALPPYLLVRFFPLKKNINLLLVLPCLWTIFELLRSYLFTGFPWLLLGTTQVSSPLAGYAPMISVYGVTFVVLLLTALIISVQRNKGQLRLLYLVCIISIILLGYGLKQITWTQQHGKAMHVSLVQGGIKQSLKWDPQHLRQVLTTYWDLSQPHLNNDLIIWPENSVPLLQHYAKNFLTDLHHAALHTDTTFILGIPTSQQSATRNFYNSAIVIGDGHGTYSKRHLVPFGEYTPLKFLFADLINYFNIPMSDFKPGPRQQSQLIANNIPIAIFICYEVAYPEQVRQSLPQSELLVTLTDDGWFGHSIAAAQQLELTQMRALETGRYFLSATNDGMTAIINPKGEIIKQAPRFTQTVLSGEVYAMRGSTPWVVIGPWPLLTFLFVGFATAVVLTQTKHSR